DTDWRSAPLDGDPRPVGVVVDHVAHAYEYLAGWMRQLVAGQPVDVNNEVVDELNAEHARTAGSVTRAGAAGHLRRSGADLAAGDGRVRRLAQVAIRHADDHRSEIEAALAAPPTGQA